MLPAQGFTFLTGAAGVHAVGAAVAQRAGDAARCRHHAREVAAMEEGGEISGMGMGKEARE